MDIFETFLTAMAILLIVAVLCGLFGCGVGYYNPHTRQLFFASLLKDLKTSGEYVMEDGTVVRFDLTSMVNADQFGQLLSSQIREAKRETLVRERQRAARERERVWARPTTQRVEP